MRKNPQALAEYQRKRDFSATPEPGTEPRGRAKKRPQALQFCIQKHDASHLHYDFRLELDGTLKSWAVPKGPSLDPKVRRLAIHVEDHPLDYANFEGHIPEGHYGGGDVIVWDRGVWLPEDSDPSAAYAKGKLKFRLQGEKLSGVWNLVKTHLAGKKEQWFLIKHRDEYARPQDQYDILLDRPESALTGQDLPDAAKPNQAKPQRVKKAPTAKPAAKKTATAPAKDAAPDLSAAHKATLPETLSPQLATLVDKAPAGDWHYELKFDGYRLLARVEGANVQLFTRNGHDWTAKLPRQAAAIRALGLESAWLDGEIVVTNADGGTDFQALQNAFEREDSSAIVFYLFDIPYLQGADLRNVPLESRREVLEHILQNQDDDVLRFSPEFQESPEHLLASACSLQFEGLIGKRSGSPYTSTRSHDWIKLKCGQRQEFVIVGYTSPQGARTHFGALLLGLHDAQSGALRYAGKVGTGFNAATLSSVHRQLKTLHCATPVVVNPPSGYDAKGVQWLSPERVCEVAYAQMTRDGAVRHAVFQGLRGDKVADQVIPEKAQRVADDAAEPTAQPAQSTPSKRKRPAKPQQDSPATQVKITHPDRVIDPSSGITKKDLAEYFGLIAPWILPDLHDRPVALVRGPDGVSGELFFQKHAQKLAIPHIRQLPRELDPDHDPLLAIDDVQGLVGAAQMGTLELHTWNATAPQLEKPDRFVLDLDPDPALPWKAMREATQLVLTLLDEIGLEAFIKTSGGKGLHIVVPLTRRHTWPAVKSFSQSIAQYLAELMPERFCAVSGPKNRVGKIYVDYLRNSRGASTVAAYSPRARDGMPVSVPLFRDELSDLKSANGWTIKTIFKRLEALGKDNPWQDLPTCKQNITAAMKQRLKRN